MTDLLSILRKSTDYLAQKGIECARVEAELLIAHALGVARLQLYLQFDRPLGEEELAPIRSLLRRRVAGEPVQYITGEAPFYDIDLAVGPGVLIPRPETERLVDIALKHYIGGSALDLCTGTGAIALSLWHAKPDLGPYVAVDVSPAALAWAHKNVAALKAAVDVREGDLFGPVRGETFSLITANPPYVTAQEYASLPSLVRDWEPKLALESGERGLDILHRLAQEAPAYLQPDGLLLSEIGADQGHSASACFANHGWDVSIEQDFNGRDRVLVARLS